MTPLSKQVRLSDQSRYSECIEIGLFFHLNRTSTVVWPRRIDPCSSTWDQQVNKMLMSVPGP